jgi:hypothetical protein
MSRINQREAKSLCDNFIRKKSNALDQIIGKEDSNAIWFDINDLEKFLIYVKTEAKNQNQKINGVRVYLGSYDENHINKNLANMTTVFLTATIDGENTMGNSDDLKADVLNMGNSGYPPKRFFQ